MRRASLRTLFALLLAGVGFGLAQAAGACEIPAPVATIDPPGFYDDAAGYAREAKPMRNFIAKLNASAAKALDDETVKKRLLELGSVIPGPAERTPEALAALVKNEIAKWTPVLKPAT